MLLAQHVSPLLGVHVLSFFDDDFVLCRFSEKESLQFQQNVKFQVLDMCAAPGSKTAQLVELIHSDENIVLPGRF